MNEGLAVLVAAFVGILGGLVGSLITVFAENRRKVWEQKLQIEREKKQYCQTQLSEFYNPIYTLLSVNGDIFRKTGPYSVSSQDPPVIQEEKRMVWNKMVENVIIPNNQRICDIIESKLHLLSNDDDTLPYLQFTRHAYAYKAFREQVYEGYENFRFPSNFYEHLNSKREVILKGLEQLRSKE